MFFLLTFIILILTLGISFFPIWHNFMTENGLKLFIKTLRKEFYNKEPALPLDNRKKYHKHFSKYLKTLITSPAHLILFSCILIFIGSNALYFSTSDYDYLNQPLTKRIEVKNSTKMKYLTIASMLMDRLQDHYENGKDWKWLGQVLFMAEDYTGSADAFRNAVKYGEDTADVYAELGETIVMNNNGKTIAEAVRAFMLALRKDRFNLKANYFLGIDKWQKTDPESAIGVFKYIVINSDEENKWHIAAKENLKEIISLTGLNEEKIDPIDLSIISRGFLP